MQKYKIAELSLDEPQDVEELNVLQFSKKEFYDWRVSKSNLSFFEYLDQQHKGINNT
jgi:hypothetical protein